MGVLQASAVATATDQQRRQGDTQTAERQERQEPPGLLPAPHRARAGAAGRAQQPRVSHSARHSVLTRVRVAGASAPPPPISRWCSYACEKIFSLTGLCLIHVLKLL